MFGQYSSQGGFSRARDGKKYSNDQAVHVWASQTVQHGSNQKGSIFFTGPTIYSYGSHFPMGHFMPCGDVVLTNADSYSVTTSAHQYRVARAVSHKRRIHVPNLGKLCETWGPLALLQPHRDADDKARGKTALLAYLADNAPDMDAEAVDYLAGLVGAKPATVLSKANKARANKLSEETKRDNAALDYEGKKFADADKAWFTETVQNSRDYDLRRTVSQLRKLHKQASARGFTARKARLWAMIQEAKARYDWMMSRKERIESNAYHKDSVKFIRRTLNAPLSGDSVSSYTFQQIASRMQTLARRYPRLAKSGMFALTIDAATAEHRDRLAAENARAAVIREREAAARFEREQAKRDAWLAGERNQYFRGADERGGALLRIVWNGRSGGAESAFDAIDNRTLQTSHGAEVPLRHAIRVFQFVKLCRERGTAWERNGKTLRVGHFQVDSVTAQGDFKAGCHTIHWAEVERVAKLNGLFDLAAEDTRDAKVSEHA